LNKFF